MNLKLDCSLRYSFENLIFPGKEEYPTLLHFAAKYGLEKLCWQLIESPGGEYACQMHNCEQHNPADIAHHAGHTKLANALQGYLVRKPIKFGLALQQ